MSNVTPIAAGGAKSSGPADKAPGKSSAKRVKAHMLRDDTAGRDGFSTHDIICGLRGVCRALDQFAVEGASEDRDLIADLAMASRVLSNMVGNRTEDFRFNEIPSRMVGK